MTVNDIEIPSMFRLAKNVSKHSTHRVKMGAVLVHKSRVISFGCNQSKTHPEAKYNGLHAEVQTLKTSGKSYLKGSVVFVYRENRKHTCH